MTFFLRLCCEFYIDPRKNTLLRQVFFRFECMSYIYLCVMFVQLGSAFDGKTVF